MRIYSMTATFGKLEHARLELQPGMNVIHAPNEWGKSTWCAFLLAMLYGLDTRSKSTRSSLADKEHYAPWSGSPMSGRIDLCWQGRDITIERSTRGRIPLGYFRAYETETGAEIQELNAANCGQLLLGVESGVYRRAGFIRLSDLPNLQDDALRRRLNALVTTGDESGDGAKLERGLRDLKNRCRFNRTGLLPQAEQERESLQKKLRELDDLVLQQQSLAARLEENEQKRQALENHAEALKQEAARSDAALVAQARQTWDLALARVEALENQQLPPREEARQHCDALEEFRNAVAHFQDQKNALPMPPQLPPVPKPFLGMDAQTAQLRAAEDALAWEKSHSLAWVLLLLLAIPAFAGAGWLLFTRQLLLTGAAVAAGVLLLFLGIFRSASQKDTQAVLLERYGSGIPEDWEKFADDYAASAAAYTQAEGEYQRIRQTLLARREALKQQRIALCGEESAERMMEYWQQILRTYEALDTARREELLAREQYRALKAMARPMSDAQSDDLPYDSQQTDQLLRGLREECQRLSTRQGELWGRIASLGDADSLRAQLSQTESRIDRLEQTYAALTLAQQTLAQASAQLQRRFAPRISGRAQQWMAALTDGKYDRLRLADDMTLQAGARQEDTLCDAQWRSEGTIDQLYLALRLAVAQELTPDAPLVLDDALVRFDDQRMRAALGILKELSQTRQVILFTCQQRELRELEGDRE